MTKTLLLPLALLTSFQVLAEEEQSDFTFGVGLGSLYSGLGANFGVRTDTDFKYVSAGCMAYSTLYGEACGVGVGWVNTDTFDFQTSNHGIGYYLGIVGSEREYYSDYKPVYGAGLGYHYFFNGINNSGFNVGVTGVVGVDHNSIGFGTLLQIGYQF